MFRTGDLHGGRYFTFTMNRPNTDPIIFDAFRVTSTVYPFEFTSANKGQKYDITAIIGDITDIDLNEISFEQYSEYQKKYDNENS